MPYFYFMTFIALFGIFMRNKLSTEVLLLLGFIFGLGYGMLNLDNLYLTSLSALFSMWIAAQFKN